jgi:hypothetical protein
VELDWPTFDGRWGMLAECYQVDACETKEMARRFDKQNFTSIKFGLGRDEMDRYYQVIEEIDRYSPSWCNVPYSPKVRVSHLKIKNQGESDQRTNFNLLDIIAPPSPFSA